MPGLFLRAFASGVVGSLSPVRGWSSLRHRFLIYGPHRRGRAIEAARVVLYRFRPNRTKKKPSMTMPALSKILAATIVTSGVAAVTAGVAPALAQNLPNGNGRDVVQMICTGCHDLSPITDAVGFSRRDWEIVVGSMIDMGATITPEQVSVIASYLAANFPPKAKQ
jgi:hypothetical protein